MFLSDRDLYSAISRGTLKIIPLASDTVRENGLDLRFGNKFCVIKGDVAVSPESPPETYMVCREVPDDGWFVIEPGSRVLAHTREKICLPNNMVGLVNLRSTYARMGLSIPPTIVDAGFCGQLTIEIIGGSVPVKVRVGDRFLHLVIGYTATPASRGYRGKYQGQSGVTPSLPDK